MTEKSYTPRWLDLRDEVAKSIGLLNAPISDRQTINVLNNITRTLMNKQALPDGLKKTFIENIRRCQPARKTDPLSAPNIDPTFRQRGGYPGSR